LEQGNFKNLVQGERGEERWVNLRLDTPTRSSCARERGKTAVDSFSEMRKIMGRDEEMFLERGG